MTLAENLDRCANGCVCPSPEVAAVRRITLQVHVVLEANDDVTDFLYPDNLDETEGLTLDRLKTIIEEDFTGFVLNEVNNCSDYPVRVVAIVADATEVSA